jgi:hypothetical protein
MSTCWDRKRGEFTLVIQSFQKQQQQQKKQMGYIVNGDVGHGVGPAVKAKDLVGEPDDLVALEVRHGCSPGARALGDKLGPEVLGQQLGCLLSLVCLLFWWRHGV